MLKNIFLIFFITSLNLLAYINIYPVTFDKSIDGNGNKEEFILYNKTPNPLRYSISLSDIGIKNSMKDWIEFYPNNLTVKPGKSEKIKVFIKAPKHAKKGEYLATLEIRESIVPTLEKTSPKNGVQILTHLKMDIAGFIGDIKPKFKINNFSITPSNKNLNVKGSIENIGERRGKVDIILTNGNKRDEYLLGSIRVLKNEKIDLSKLSHELENKAQEKKIKSYKKLIIREQGSNRNITEILL